MFYKTVVGIAAIIAVLLGIVGGSCAAKKKVLVIKSLELPPMSITVNSEGIPVFSSDPTPIAETALGVVTKVAEPWLKSPSIGGDNYKATLHLNKPLTVSSLEGVQEILFLYDRYGFGLIDVGDHLEFNFDSQGKCLGVFSLAHRITTAPAATKSTTEPTSKPDSTPSSEPVIHHIKK